MAAVQIARATVETPVERIRDRIEVPASIIDRMGVRVSDLRGQTVPVLDSEIHLKRIVVRGCSRFAHGDLAESEKWPVEVGIVVPLLIARRFGSLSGTGLMFRLSR